MRLAYKDTLDRHSFMIIYERLPYKKLKAIQV